MFPDPKRPSRRAAVRGLAAAAGLAGLSGIRKPAPAAPVAPVAEDARELVIATVGDTLSGPVLHNGAEIAVDEVNRSGGVLGRRLRLYSETVEWNKVNPRAQAIEVAARVVGQGDVIAVIGHSDVTDALPAAITYLRHDALLLVPTITTTSLTMHGLPNVFATLPDNGDLATQTARFVADLGLKRGFIMRGRGYDPLEISLAYRDTAAVLGLTIVDEVSLSSLSRTHDFIPRLQGKQFDHLVLVAPLEWQVQLVKFAADLGLNVLCVMPSIYQSPTVVQTQLTGVLGDNKGRPFRLRTLVPVLRDHRAPTPEQAQWERTYLARYNSEPVDHALQATDAVNLVVAGLGEVGRISIPGQDDAVTRKSVTDELVQVMHGELAFRGLSGRFSFNRTGRIYTRLLGFASIRSANARDTAYYMPGV